MPKQQKKRESRANGIMKMIKKAILGLNAIRKCIQRKLEVKSNYREMSTKKQGSKWRSWKNLGFKVSTP